jgi:hypothetical protein
MRRQRGKLSLNTALVGAEGSTGCFGNLTGLVQRSGGHVGEIKLIALSWLKMMVEAKRAAVSANILFWRLMAPEHGFVVGHGATT